MKKMITCTLIILISINATQWIEPKSQLEQLLVIDDYTPTLSHESGFFEESFYLTIDAKPNTIVYYTLDGSEPTVFSIRYVEPILIEEQYIEATGEEYLIQNQIPPHETIPVASYPISFIRTGSDKWKSPTQDIFKATTLKVKAIHFSGDESPVLTHTYFVDSNMFEKYSFPIISITTDIKNLYDYETGINIPGIHYDPTIEEVSNKNRTGNYYQTGPEWEKPIYIEMFETDGTRVIAQEAGIRVHGGLSRKYPIKSYRLYARSEYDESTYFDYQFFDDQDIDRFKRIILRGGGQTYEYSFLGEAAAHKLLRTTSLDIQYSTPVILFMNGEYFGIRNIRDRHDDWYLSIKYDIPRSQVTILGGHGNLADGDLNGQTHYLDMYRFITRNDMTSSRNYEYVNTLMDVENFIDYYAAQLYFANVDWPQNNIQYWRYNVAYNSQAPMGQDGRWRWMVYDIDAGFGASWGGYYPEFNSFERITGDSWRTGQLFTSLLNNNTFKVQFINRMMDMLNTNLSAAYATPIVEEMIELYAPEMDEHIGYYGYPTSYNHWTSYVNRVRQFALNRPEHLIEHMKAYFGLEDTYQLSLRSNINQGLVKLNSIDVGQLDSDPIWLGTYMKDVPITLTAKPNDGYRIVGWYDEFHNLLSDKLTYTFTPQADTYIQAIYEVGTQVYPVEEVESEAILFIIASGTLVSIFALVVFVEKYRLKKIRK